MQLHPFRKTLLFALPLGMSIIMGCSDNPTTTTSSTTSSSSGQGGGGAGGQGGMGGGGAGGEGGGMAAIPGKSGGSLVSAGHVVKGQQYRLVFTMGQSSPIQSNVKSPSYQMNGGVIGATGSPQ